MSPKRHHNQDTSALEKAIRLRIRHAREENHFTPEELDRFLGEKKGLTRRLEAGRASIHVSRVYRYAKALGIPLDVLFEDLDDLGPRSLSMAKDGPPPDEVEKFARHFNDLKSPDHRREISELVRSIARKKG